MKNIMEQDPRFNPAWREDVLDLTSIEIPLILPRPTSKEKDTWVVSEYKRHEIVFGEPYKYLTPRQIVSVVKRSKLGSDLVFTSPGEGEVENPKLLIDLVFPPKAWMSNTLQECSAMLAAAKVARGKVLVGGLGLAIYPQFILHLKQPIESITIVESSSEVLELVGTRWLDHVDVDMRGRINIVQDTIQAYLQNCTELFDTIFFDVWEDSDPRYLSQTNHLIQLGLQKCTPTGQIQSWGYALAVDTFVRDAAMYVEQDFKFDDFVLDPALERLGEWVKQQDKSTLTPEEIQRVAREIATTTAIAGYDRDDCFTAYAISHMHAYMNYAHTQKKVITAD